MGVSYGIEEFTTELRDLLKDKLNKTVLDISAAKNDPVTIPQVDPQAHFFQTLDNQVINYSPAVFVFVSDARIADEAAGSVAATYDVNVYVLFGDLNQPDIEKLLFRHHEALKTLIVREWRKFSMLRCAINSLDPAGFASVNTTEYLRTTGLTIEVTLGN